MDARLCADTWPTPAGSRRYVARPEPGGKRTAAALPAALLAALLAAIVALARSGTVSGTLNLAVAVVGAVLLAAGARVWQLLQVAEESLLVRAGEGLMLHSKNGAGFEAIDAIAAADVADVFIAEAVGVGRCFFYLACLVPGDGEKREPRLAVPFEKLRLPLHELQSVCSGTRALLWPDGPPGEDPSETAPEPAPASTPEPHVRLRT